jgi:hypothetical protein
MVPDLVLGVERGHPERPVGDLAERLDDPVARAVVLNTARAVEAVPELLSLGPHLLATGVVRRAPAAGVLRAASPAWARPGGLFCSGCGTLHQRGVFVKSHTCAASSARRLVIEGVYPL